MRVGFVHSTTPQEKPGGAQYHVFDLMGAAPDNVAPIWCLPGKWERNCDAYVVADPTGSPVTDVKWLIDDCRAPKLRLVMGYEGVPRSDVDPLNASMRAIVFKSPLHQAVYAQMYPLPQGPLVGCLPPPMDVQAVMASNGSPERKGIAWAGAWESRNGMDIIMKWAREHKSYVDMVGMGLKHGEGGEWWSLQGQAPDRETVWRFMAAHKAFVHMPRWPSPFGIAAMEAYATGCDLILSGRIGATSYGEPPSAVLGRCARATSDFWKLVDEVTS